MQGSESVPPVMAAVDVVPLRLRPGDPAMPLEVLLVRRLPAPFAWQWALPGALLGGDELLADCARGLLRERTDQVESYLEQLYTFDAVDRGPRQRALSVAYWALLRTDERAPSEPEQDDARWWSVQ